METDNSPKTQHAANEEGIKGKEYNPNKVPLFHRLRNLFFSMALLAYGTYGLWVNDLYIPAGDPKGIHLHDLPAWVMFGAFVSACLVMISVCIDHYDKRNNEINYQRFASTFQHVAYFFFALSASMQITSYDGSLKGLAVLVPVFSGFSLILLWLARLFAKREREDKLQIEIWKEAERSNLATFAADASVHGYSLIGKDAQTMQYDQEPRYLENSLQALAVKRTLRNTAGEYFYWMWSSDSPRYVKHITQVNAKIILKKDYLEP
jgi:hypothetical protein